jgi:hypothetical protein
MRTMAVRRSRTTRAFAAWAAVGAAAVAGCDANEDPDVSVTGPSFLIVAPAAIQPTSPEEGTTIYVQARGGTFVGITTYGGKHRYLQLAGDAIESCAELPGSEPLYLLVKPDDVECIVEARLYADCDPEGGTALQMCNDHSSFVESAVVPIAARLFNRAAFSVDAATPPRFIDAGRDAADAASDRGKADSPADGSRGDR